MEYLLHILPWIWLTCRQVKEDKKKEEKNYEPNWHGKSPPSEHADGSLEKPAARVLIYIVWGVRNCQESFFDGPTQLMALLKKWNPIATAKSTTLVSFPSKKLAAFYSIQKYLPLCVWEKSDNFLHGEAFIEYMPAFSNNSSTSSTFNFCI